MTTKEKKTQSGSHGRGARRPAGRFIPAAVVLGAAAVILFGVSVRPVSFTRHGSFFGSWVHVTVVAPAWRCGRVDRALDEVWRRFADIHVRLGADHPLSEIRALNDHPNEPVEVSPDTFDLIRRAVSFYELSNGVFNPAVEPLIRLWKRAARDNRLPSDEEIRTALARCDARKVRFFDGRRILLPDGVRLRLDSIGDGYAADEAARLLEARGFHRFLVDAAGELRVEGTNTRGRAWRVGIQDPTDPHRLWSVVAVTSGAVSTSGSYERGFEVGGRWFSHIMDPRNGRPTEGPLSATAICPSAVFADFVSTVLCVLSPREGLKWTAGLPQRCAVLILSEEDGTIREYKNPDWDDFELSKPKAGIQ